MTGQSCPSCSATHTPHSPEKKRKKGKENRMMPALQATLNLLGVQMGSDLQNVGVGVEWDWGRSSCDGQVPMLSKWR